MRKTKKVLALGQEDWIHLVHRALPYWQKNDFVGVHNFWALCALPQSVLVDAVVIHRTFDRDDLRCAAQYIRRRWPDALVVVVGEQAKHLDDPLYDHLANGGTSSEELALLIETSVETKRQNRTHVRPVLSGARR
jgi:hypothetical protein